MEAVTEEQWPSDDMWESLKDGMLLCKFINVLHPGAVSKFTNTARPGVKFKEQKERENIDMFLNGCIAFGLRQGNLFRSPDLYEKRVSYPKKILDCILAVQRVAEKGSTKDKFSASGAGWGNTTNDMIAEQKKLRAEMEAKGGSGDSSSDAKSRGTSKALQEATAGVSEVADAQDEADMNAARAWLEAVSGIMFPPSGDLWEATKDGTLLCTVMNIIKPGAISKVNKPGTPFKEMENLSSFTAECKKLGVRDSDVFRPPDLWEKRVSYPKAIINCIHSLAKVCKKVKTFSGPYLQVEKIRQ